MSQGGYPGQQPSYGEQPSFGGGGQQPPAYGQPGYGPPPAGYGRPRRRFGIVGTVLALIGAVLLVVAFTAVDWYKHGGGHAHFSDVKRAVNGFDRLNSAAGIAHAYFDWLGWVLFVAAVVVALLANLPTPLAPIMRIIGVLLGIAGLVVTFVAIKLSSKTGVPGASGTSFHDYLKNAGPGYYLALGGFLLVTIGAAIGARRNKVVV